MKVALHNLGCKVNAYETDAMQQKLTENGYEIVNYDEFADIYIVNTCSVTNVAERKSRQQLHKGKKINPDAIIVAVGCYSQINSEQADADEKIDLVIGNNRKQDIVSIIEEYIGENKETAKHAVDVIDINHEKEYEEMQLSTVTEHTRAYVKIQDGCNQFCTYCIIPYARGRVRSRRPENVIREAQGLADAGFLEIVLTGIHIGSYGLDFESSNETALISLIEELGNVEGIERIRMSSFEPRILTEEFVERLSKVEKMCPHFHLSMQSGCDRTLKRMNRKYTTDEYYEKVILLRKYFENPAITTDVIVGFPGETDDEFAETVAFIKKILFYETHIFKYSKRNGTPAAIMKEQISGEIKTQRSKILMDLGEEKAYEYRRNLVNSVRSVLFEEKKEIYGRNYQIGHTREYVKVAVPTEEDLTNQILEVSIDGFITKELMSASCNL